MSNFNSNSNIDNLPPNLQNHEHYRSKANPNIFFKKPSRGMSSSYVIFFSHILLKKIILWFFMYFLKINFRK